MAAGGIEIAEQTSIPGLGFGRVVGFEGLGSLSVDVVGDHELRGEFGVAVGVGGTQGAFFRNRNHVGDAGGIAIDGG